MIQPPTGPCETIERCIAPLTSYAGAPEDLVISGDGELGSGLAVENTAAAEVSRKSASHRSHGVPNYVSPLTWCAKLRFIIFSKNARSVIRGGTAPPKALET